MAEISAAVLGSSSEAQSADVEVTIDTLGQNEDGGEPPEGDTIEVDVGSGPPSPTGSAADLGSENATGFGTIQGEEQMPDHLSDVSDTGWDTDLEIEEEKNEYDPTGGKTYQKSCEVLGIIPASYFLRTIQAQDTTISMSHHGVGPKGAKAIAVALTSNTTVTHLDLSDNGLGAEGCIAIITMMKENCYITHLDLSDNNLESAGAFAVGTVVSFNSTLTHLGIRGNGFDDKAAEPMAELIRSSYRITFLDLSHNEFGSEAGEILGPALADSEVLQSLDLSWNYIRRKGAIAIAAGLKNNQTLKVLNLSYNGLGNEGAVAIADAIKTNSTLEELDISNNRVSLDGATVIAKVLPTNENLKVFKVGKNPIQPKGVLTFLEALKASSNGTLQCLDFDGVTITLEIAGILKEMRDSHAHLRVAHGGTGGYKKPKPLLEPPEKLLKYARENKLELIDLFRAFDKEQQHVLPEEEFRKALKHISAPLMEFERLKLIKLFKKEGGEVEGEIVNIDYNALVETATATLDGTKPS